MTSNNETTPLLNTESNQSRSIRVLGKQTPPNVGKKIGSPADYQNLNASPRLNMLLNSAAMSPMIGGRSPSLGAQIFKGPPHLNLDTDHKQSFFVIYYLCGFYFMISMLLKSTLPFMVGFFKGHECEWVFGWYNGIYYLGRVLANTTVGWASRNFDIKQNLQVSIVLSLVGIVIFCSGVYIPTQTTIVGGMLFGQCIQGFATGMMAGAVGMYIQLFHRGDVSVSAAFAIAYNVGDICGPIIALPFSYFGWGLSGLCYFLLVVPVVMFATTSAVVPSGLVPIQETGDGDEENADDLPTGMNLSAKVYIMVAGALSAFYTSYEFNIPILYDSLGYDTSMISVFLDIMAISALCGSFFANQLPNRPQYLNEMFLLFLTAAYAVSYIRSTIPYVFTMIVVCIVGEFQGIVNSTIVLQFLTIQEYGWYRNMNEGGRVLLQPVFASCLQFIPRTFFIVISAMHIIVYGFLWKTKALLSVDEENEKIESNQLETKEV